MANYIILKRVEQLKTALEKSVNPHTYNNIVADYDAQVKNNKTGQIGHARTYKDDPKYVCFFVPDDNVAYDIPKAEFNKDFTITLMITARRLKDQEATTVICANRSSTYCEYTTQSIDHL